MVAFLALSLNSCKKEVIETTKDKETVMDANVALQRFDKTYEESMNLVFVLLNDGNSFKQSSVASCADVTIDTSSLPYHATFNFGAGCTDDDGNFRSGVVELEFNQMENMREPGAHVTATFTDFVLNDVKNNGSFVFNNDGYNGNSNLQFAFSFNLQLEDLTNSETATMDGVTSYEFIAGQDTQTDEDDYLALTGSLNGTVASSSTTMTLTVLQPVIKHRGQGCSRNYIQGVVKIEQNGQTDKFIDYGTGTCDELATETVGTTVTTITLDGGFQ